MDADRFDVFARLLGHATPRRGALAALVAASTAVARRPALAARRSPSTPTPANAFGCLNVGQKCYGDAAACCSGRCRGKRPKPGKPDRRRCGAHNTGGCTASQDFCAVGVPPAECGTSGACYRTTGRGSFCAKNGGTAPPDAICTDCRRDADCDPATFGPNAACLVCAFCTGVPGNTGTACAGPAA